MKNIFRKLLLKQNNMKILSSLFLAAILLTGTANAQEKITHTKKVNFGIKGGVNIYNINNSNAINYDPVVGFHAGFLAHIHLDKKFAIQPEIFYSTGGANYKNGPFDTRYNLGYINVPVLFQYMILNGLRLQAGPQLGFLVSAKSAYFSARICFLYRSIIRYFSAVKR